MKITISFPLTFFFLKLPKRFLASPSLLKSSENATPPHTLATSIRSKPLPSYKEPSSFPDLENLSYFSSLGPKPLALRESKVLKHTTS